MEHQKIPLRSFFLRIALILFVFMVGITVVVLKRHDDFINREILATARSYHTTLMFFWKWNSDNGGLFTMKKPEGKPVLKNHAIMTREVSEYSRQAGSPAFSITSLNPLNPLNRPDNFETDALRSFEKGAGEYFRKETSGDRIFFGSTDGYIHSINI